MTSLSHNTNPSVESKQTLATLRSDPVLFSPNPTMSRRDSRDSDSKRQRSRFDREPSPTRSRRDEKDENMRGTRKVDSESAKQTDQDQKQQRHRMQDTLPLESPLAALLKEENGVPAKESDKIPGGHVEGTKHSSVPAELPRSRSYSEHDDRRNAGQVVRSSRRGSDAERGSWRDIKDRHDDRTVSRTTTNVTRPRNEKPKGDGNRTWRQDGFFEMEAGRPPTRKRPAFRETKIPVDSENTDKTEVETANPSVEGSRKEERGNKPRYLDRSHRPHFLDRSRKQFGGERVPYREDVQRGFFPSRERYVSGAGHNHRGGDRFSGRQGYNSSGGGGGGGTEKWKHDLYHEADKSPAQKNEEEQIAKVESLLAS